MLGKGSRPTIGKLTGALRSSGVVVSSTSPRSPLDCGMGSPRGPKTYDQQCGVGLGLVVALNNTNSKNNNNNNNTCNNYHGGEILAKYTVCGRISCGSNPIPMNKSSWIDNNTYRRDNYQEIDDMLEEEFTYITCHGPSNSVTTTVYYDDVENGRGGVTALAGRGISQNLGVFRISSPATFDDHFSITNSNFLSTCHSCRNTLHGKDIYMYRGEKAFCSEECRQRQISIDERKELCTFEASRSINDSSSPYSNYTSRGGILAV
ncbi:hypothetical protein vseg_016204 [Gypsophila vaccaria]